MFRPEKIKSRFRPSHINKLLQELLKVKTKTPTSKGEKVNRYELTPRYSAEEIIKYLEVRIDEVKEKKWDNSHYFEYPVYRIEKSHSGALRSYELNKGIQVNCDDNKYNPGRIRDICYASNPQISDEELVDHYIKLCLTFYLKDNTAIPIYI